jgi:hypothetical protein
MAAKRSSKESTSGETQPVLRGFQVEVTPGKGGAYGIVLNEINGNPPRTIPIATVQATALNRVLPHIMQALVNSGHQRTTLGPTIKAPINLDENAGVRLALTLIAATANVRISRIDAIAETIQHMATEEAFYWYSKAMGPNKTRVRKALRIFLADE